MDPLIMIARINAMYEGSKRLLVFLIVTLLACTIVSGVMVVIENLGISAQEAILSGYSTCMTIIGVTDMDSMNLNRETVVSPIVWEILTMFLTVWIVIKHFRELRRSPTGSTIGDCFMVLIKSHTIYFLAFATVACFMLSSASPNNAMLQTFVFGPRLILSIREYYAKVTARADGGISITSIAFQAGGGVLTGIDVSTGGDM
ncbi:hypothetical protein BDR07DRAFT_1421239 [Suillus spraguei]|nr:hypothetical protein BDR07DRAFT_1421239 [Suillus spraguei]